MKSKTAGLRILDQAIEINLAILRKKSKDLSSKILTIGRSSAMLIAVIEKHQITLVQNNSIITLEVATVSCLAGRFRPLLKCPRAHEGNFQSLYLFNGELACRKCLKLRYRSNLASGSKERARIQRMKTMHKLGRQADGTLPEHKKFEWRKKYFEKIAHIKDLENEHYVELKGRIKVSRE